MLNTATSFHFQKLDKLTTKEVAIAFHIANGASTKSIATIFRVKSNTVSTHKKNIFSKLEVKSSVGLYKMLNE